MSNIIIPRGKMIVLKENSNGKYDVLFTIDNSEFLKIGEITNPKKLIANPLNLIPADVGDFGGGFANYTPPAEAEEGEMRYAEDTNATTPGKRLYIYANGKWSYVTLS